MMQLNAAQHVSGVLTSKQSRTGQAGYQTLFCTRDLLAPDEIRIIERQAQLSFGGDRQTKWQSYRLSSNRHVISRLTPIAEPDEFGRRGRFFAHSLIFDAANAVQVDETLFDLLQPARFFVSLDKVLASDAMRSGHIPALAIDCKMKSAREGQKSLRDWSGEQLDRIYLLMRNPQQLLDEQQHVTLVGNESEILAALRVAFLLAAPGARKFCSFDSRGPACLDQSDVVFWGHGAPAAETADYLIDCEKREVRIRAGSPALADGFSLEKAPVLGRAILERLKLPSETMLASLLNRRYAAFIAEPIYQALLHESHLTLSGDELEFLGQFQQAHTGLALLLSLKTGNESQRLQTLAAMDLDSYVQRLKELRSTPSFQPWQGLSPVFMSTWRDLFRGKYGIEDLEAAIAAVAEHGDNQDQEHVENIHEYLDSEERKSLSAWLKSKPYKFRRLQAGLDRPVRSRTESRHWFWSHMLWFRRW
ncbi:MAG TPA: hypothetical protein VK582_12220 [Pyrinomonadaceae bacterium]|nr:hypothetical protein [Pyrinomonadaceae bacterium]